jgi:hypothetical protein
MNENEIQVPARKRAPGMKWKRFFNLKVGDFFWIGSLPMAKTSWCGCTGGDGSICAINPLRKVRSQEPVRRAPKS